MKNQKGGIHPLMAAAAVSVTLVCLVGVAAITGILPTSHSTSAPVASVPAAAPVAAVAPVTPAASVETKVAAAEPAPAPVKHAAPAVKHAAPKPHAQVTQTAAICSNCGRVESVEAIKKNAEGSGVGIAGGAVVGGLLGNQVGGGNGKTLATVAGAVAGGFAGNEVEKRVRATTSWEVRVRMEDGTLRTFPYTTQPGWNAGDRVKVINGALASQA
jgi:outer membrane lipoprotein SlyB